MLLVARTDLQLLLGTVQRGNPLGGLRTDEWLRVAIPKAPDKQSLQIRVQDGKTRRGGPPLQTRGCAQSVREETALDAFLGQARLPQAAERVVALKEQLEQQNPQPETIAFKSAFDVAEPCAL
jgi:hypothetical protein